jgi:hypothetical protein
MEIEPKGEVQGEVFSRRLSGCILYLLSFGGYDFCAEREMVSDQTETRSQAMSFDQKHTLNICHTLLQNLLQDLRVF